MVSIEILHFMQFFGRTRDGPLWTDSKQFSTRTRLEASFSISEKDSMDCPTPLAE
jgi:hypothetical protein